MSDNSWIFRHWKRDTHSAKKIQLYYQWASHSQIFFFPHFWWQFILLNEYLFSPWFIQVFSMLSQSIHLYPFIICIVVQLFCILWLNFVYLCWQEKGSTKGEEDYVNKEKNNRFVRIHILQSIKTWHSFQTRC